MEQALTLKQAAQKLGMSYRTVFDSRHQIGFRLPGSRIWRVWPSALAQLSRPRNNLTRLSVRVDGDLQCQSINDPIPIYGGSISARQAASELDDLLGRKTAKRPRSSMTA